MWYLSDARDSRRETLISSVLDAEPVQCQRVAGPSLLRAHAGGERPSGFMALPAPALDKADLEALISHFAALPRPEPAQRVGPAFFERGEAVARDGVTPNGVPACLCCHGAGRSLAYPDLAGQPTP